jgi:DNA topoisomerase-1
MATKQWIERRRVGRGFQYWHEGRQVDDSAAIEYYKHLGIPPAWRDVRISHNRRSKVVATGTDKAGRKQYVYHASFRARQEQEKFERILRFARALPAMRQTTERHLRHHRLDYEKVCACIVRLIDEAYFRIGNDVYARQNHSYGLTTMRSKHTTVHGSTITFDFDGKSGQHHTTQITDRALAKIVKQLDELPGYEVFKYYDEHGQQHDVTSTDVNAYIKSIMGEEFSAKDFRTWGGTLIAAGELAGCERGETDRERKKTVTACVKKVARKLGNTPAIARSSYIDPRIIDSFMVGNDLQAIRSTVETMAEDSYITPDEHCVLQILEKGAAASC